MEKTTRDIPPIVHVPTMAEQYETKFGAKSPGCATCLHSYLEKLAPVGPLSRTCREGPPLVQLVMVQGGAGAQLIPRLVSDDFFCHRHRLTL